MSGPIIELPADCFEMPMPFYADTVAAWMIWPNDEIARSIALQHYALKRLYEHRASVPREVIEQALDAALKLPDEESIRQAAYRRVAEGFVAGNIFIDVIGGAQIGRVVKLGDVIEKLSGRTSINPLAKTITTPNVRMSRLDTLPSPQNDVA